MLRNIKFDRHCALSKSVLHLYSVNIVHERKAISQFLRDKCQQENDLWNFQNKVSYFFPSNGHINPNCMAKI
jgi:hypothetical protein